MARLQVLCCGMHRDQWQLQYINGDARHRCARLDKTDGKM